MRKHRTKCLIKSVAGSTLLVWLFLTASAAHAGNIIVNGDFELASVPGCTYPSCWGFTSAYTYVPPPYSTVPGSHSLFYEGTFGVLTDPSQAHGAATSYGDHTTGTGYMMAVNGANLVANEVVWEETVQVSPNTPYQFSMWSSSWDSGSPAVLEFLFNGTSIGTLTDSITPGVWWNFATGWDSGANTSLTIDIIDLNTATMGNDFAIDDISLSPEPTTLLLLGSGLAAIGILRLRRLRR
jgi:hypothetical protein